jgi:FOG: CheY-like receiver
VVCDLFMPKTDGLETVSELWQQSASVLIISTSGYLDKVIGEG